MKVLKIQENKRQELTDNVIVICTYITLDNNEIDGISIEYKDLYPDFEEIEIQESNSLFRN